MTFRESWGLAPKPRHNCPICNAETIRGRRCFTHAQGDRNRIRRAVDTHRYIRLVCKLVDEARQAS